MYGSFKRCELGVHLVLFARLHLFLCCSVFMDVCFGTFLFFFRSVIHKKIVFPFKNFNYQRVHPSSSPPPSPRPLLLLFNPSFYVFSDAMRIDFVLLDVSFDWWF
ncbi:hypothetical protein Tcan_05925 [Toxocara canis]|uniref:Uncharacterized protein n=1 Tax=Toxocara canis TaxID=6265 RepID=A0A0B2VZ03_TOXCA|nr:hypothetical protein Tcan_05925 [Toxocara canis]